MADMGRPPVFKDSEDLLNKGLEYFEWVKGEKHMTVDKEGLQVESWTRLPEYVTITGLCIFLGFDSRQSFYDQEKREDFSYPIKKLRMMVENSYEQGLRSQACTGSIFALKNMGWKDKTETELSGNLELKQITGMVVKKKDASQL